MDEVNELMESLMIDVAAEGIGTSAGVGLLWALFFGGTFAGFVEILNLLANTI